MSYQKIGFLVGVGGNPTGIGTYIQQCDAAGVPAVIFANDATTGISNALELIKNGSTVPHVLAYRVVKDRNPYYSVPNYDLPPGDAADDFYNRIEPLIPPELKEYKQYIWILLGNELDKTRMDWLGWWAYYSSVLWNKNGYKVGMIGFNSGEPEINGWHENGMKAYLQYAADNQDKAAINIHEYSFSEDDILVGYPFLVGRFQHLLKACDEMKIDRPSILIGEWGWRQDVIPDPITSMDHINDVANLYSQFENVLGAATWTLQNWHNQVYDKVQKLIVPVTELSVNYTQGTFSEELIVQSEQPDHSNPESTVFGVDVSHHQGRMNWQTAKDAGVKWTYIRATRGNDFTDTYFTENWTGTKENEIPRGAYHYYRAWQDPISQAEYFSKVLPDDWELYPAMDIEDRQNASANENEDIRRFLLHFEKITGIRPVIYTAAWYWNTIVGNTDWAKDYDLWVANWDASKPLLPIGWNDYVFWQYDVVSEGAKYGAQSEKIDVNIFNGTYEDFSSYIVTDFPEPDPDHCFDIDPFTNLVILHPKELNQSQEDWVHTAMTNGIDVDGQNKVIGFAGWSTSNAYKDILDAIDAGKTNSRLLILDGEKIDVGITSEWMKQNCPKLFEYTRWYTSEEPEPPDENNPLTGLKLGYLFDVPYVYTSRFNAPRSYGLHEGIDADVLTPGDNKSNVYAVYPGVVDRIVTEAAGSAYGNYVRVRHEHNSGVFYTRYAHLDKIYVTIDSPVSTKNAVGEVGDTGNVTGEHVHFNLEVPGFGLDGYVVADVVDPEPYLPDPSTLPVPIPKIDLKDYIIGDGRRWYLKNQDGSQQQIMQCQTDGSVHFQVKGEQWESFLIDADWIRRDTDTSPGGGRYYTQRESGTPARWLPRNMSVGESFTVSLQVQFYKLSDCSPSQANSGNVIDTRKFIKHYDSWTSNHGITLQDVARIEWVNGGERYYYARNYGLVGWENTNSATPVWFHISELVNDNNNNVRLKGCFGG